MSMRPGGRSARVAVALSGLAVLAAYLIPALRHPGAAWPLWDVRVYWWGGQQAAHGAALYRGGGVHDFTYPPFAAAVFGTGAGTTPGFLKVVITAASAAGLPVLCWLSLGAAGVRRRPEIVLAVTALALFAVPVRYTLHLGEVNIVLAALVATDLLRRRDGGWWQGVATGLAAGIKLTPLIFVVYLLVTGRVRAGLTAAATFAATIVAGCILLPSQSAAFWLGGLFLDERRIADPANPADQSLAGLMARLAGKPAAAGSWWLAAALVTGLAGLAIAVAAHRRGHRLGGVACCAITSLLISPISWTHHWVWSVPLLVALTVTAWRRRSPWFWLAAVAVAVVFSGLIPVPWPGHGGSARALADDLYVMCGLAVLAGAAAALAAEQAAARRNPDGGPGSPHPPRRVTSIST